MQRRSEERMASDFDRFALQSKKRHSTECDTRLDSKETVESGLFEMTGGLKGEQQERTDAIGSDRIQTETDQGEQRGRERERERERAKGRVAGQMSWYDDLRQSN
jgi:hypothetical protein